VARYGTAAATVAGLWIDCGLAPDTTLGLEAPLFEAVCGVLEGRQLKAEREEHRRRHEEDMRNAADMLRVLHGGNRDN
jgi:hypothetical protein